jgi:hypothetical protein
MEVWRSWWVTKAQLHLKTENIPRKSNLGGILLTNDGMVLLLFLLNDTFWNLSSVFVIELLWRLYKEFH